MASRTEQKAKTRAERQERELVAVQKAQRRKRIGILAAIVGAAVVAVVGLIIISQKGSDAGGEKIVGASRVARQLKDVPQSGALLGRPGAAVEITEFADLQCPACKEFSDNSLPETIDTVIKANKASIDIKLLNFIGPQSALAAKAALAAGDQNKLWNFVELMYLNQRTENSGYITSEYLTSIAGKIRGLDVDQWQKDRKATAVGRSLDKNQAAAETAGITATPTFVFKGKRGSQEELEGVVSASDFSATVIGLAK